MPGDSKTEKATPKRRKDERKKGHTFSSKDIISVVSLLASFIIVQAMFPSIISRLNTSFYKFFGYAGTRETISLSFLNDMSRDIIITCIIILAPIMGVTIFASVVAAGAQTKFLFSGESMKPKFSRMNPMKGIKNMFSMKSLMEIVKGIIKISIILYIIYNFFQDKMTSFVKTLSIGIVESSSFILSSIMELVYNVCIIFVFIAAMDYLYQWWDYEKQLKMSKQEIKEEYKQTEGDPQIKGKIKERQRKVAMSRMMQAVPDADVVIRNPTHYAVALKYDIERDNAPVMVAKGQDEAALRIVRVAEQNDVYVLENKELARAIYAAAEINQEIPFEFYNAVAEILALVFEIKKKQI